VLIFWFFLLKQQQQQQTNNNNNKNKKKKKKKKKQPDSAFMQTAQISLHLPHAKYVGPFMSLMFETTTFTKRHLAESPTSRCRIILFGLYPRKQSRTCYAAKEKLA
jgi:hypothetical protein